jgi:hypothetical protein
MKGVAAAAHFDGRRNFVAMLRGRKRYEQYIGSAVQEFRWCDVLPAAPGACLPFVFSPLIVARPVSCVCLIQVHPAAADRVQEPGAVLPRPPQRAALEGGLVGPRRGKGRLLRA